MAHNRQLLTDLDFQEAVEKQTPIRIFLNDQMIDSGVIITRFSDSLIVTQAGVSDLSYRERNACEFYEMKKR
jgi:hypothetical protein